MSIPQKKQAIVVGAGLVGSLWAILIAKRGYQVDVFERRSDMRNAGFIGGRSINLAMSTRGWKAMDKAGIRSAIEAHAIPMNGRMMHSVEGELTYQAYGQEGQAIYSVSRGGLNLELLKLADQYDNVNLHFDQRCRRVDVDTNTLTFEHHPSGKHTEIQAPLIFGADGAFSAIRGSLMKTPRFNYSQQYLTHAYKELTIPATPEGGFGIEKNALHIWPRHSFMLIALPNADGSFTCTLFLPFEGEESFENLKDDAAITRFMDTYFSDAKALMPNYLQDFKENPTSSLVTVRCSPWHYDGRILLIGDASHAIVPFYGQGMNSGFEDCTVLDEMVDAYGEDWDTIIRTFSKERVKDANAIADLALRNFIEMRDKVADPKFLLRKKIAAHLQEKYPDQFLPLYSQVTFSHIPYSQALAEGHAQDELFAEILAIDGVEEKWDGPEVEAVFREWLQERG
jgi:kynurenine 3-monooxygenase